MTKARQVEPRDRAAWTAWLERNHASAPEVTLVFHRKGAPTPSITYAEAVEEALCFGWIDGVKRKLDHWRYSHRFTPRRPGGTWSAINRARVARLDAAGLMRPAGRAVIEAAQRTGGWERAGWPAEVVEPAELTAALARSKRARRFFDALAPSHRKAWCLWVGDAKQTETRARRAAKAIALLADGVKQRNA